MQTELFRKTLQHIGEYLEQDVSYLTCASRLDTSVAGLDSIKLFERPYISKTVLKLTSMKKSNPTKTSSTRSNGIVRLVAQRAISQLVRHTAGMPHHLSLSSSSLSRRNHQSLRLVILRFTLSFRNVEEMLAMRGVVLTYETGREWLPQVRPDLRQQSAPKISETRGPVAS
jgi:hypothetical protein